MRIHSVAVMASLLCFSITTFADNTPPTPDQLSRLQDQVTATAVTQGKACPHMDQGLPAADANEAVNCAIARHAHQEAMDNLTWAKQVRDANPGEAPPLSQDKKYEVCVLADPDRAHAGRNCHYLLETPSQTDESPDSLFYSGQ